MKRIVDAGRFLLDTGLLFEINRKILHPLGLALEVSIDDNNKVVFSAIQDAREDDEEGYLFSEDSFKESSEKLQKFMEESGDERLKTRQLKLGFICQEIKKDE